MLKIPLTLREILCFPRYELGGSWRGMVSGKPQVSELKNWMPKHSKNKKKPNVEIELKAGGDPHRSEKPGWSAGDMR